MENNNYKIMSIEKNKKEVAKSLGILGIGCLVLGAGIVGMRYFGEALINKLNEDTPLKTIVALCGYGPLTGASLLTSIGGGCMLSKNIPIFKDNLKELKMKKKKNN
jgi:hypothetical protein